MADFGRRAPLVLVTVLFMALLSARPVFSAGPKGKDLERNLRTKIKLVFLFEKDLPDLAKRGQGISQLENEIRGALEAEPEASGILDLFHDLQLAWAKLELSRGDVDQAILHFEEIIRSGPSSRGYQEAALTTADLHVSRGAAFEDAGDDGQALLKYGRAEELYRAAGREDRALEIGRKSATIEAKEGLKAYRVKDYDLAFGILSKLAARKRPGFAGSEGDQALAWMVEQTGVLTVTTLAVPAQVPGQDVTGLEIALERTGRGAETRRPFAAKFRWEVGEYRLGLLGRDGKMVLSVPVKLTRAGGTASIPSKLPDGMAFIPAGGKVSRPFFIDKTEVTVQAFTKVFPSHRCRSSRANFTAYGVTFAEAKSYASKVGKKLPSEQQWLRAAFGDKNEKYPWGNTDAGSINRHCNVGTRGPTAVGSFPSGRNDFGLDDMAGNVWEWLADEYAIGGGFGRSRLATNRAPAGWTHPVDYLRHKKPSSRLYDTFEDLVRQQKYDKYRVTDEKLEEVGFRCVLEF